MATINEAMLMRIESAGAEHAKLDTSSGLSGRDIRSRWKRAPTIMKVYVALLRLLMLDRIKAGYMSVSGGLGVLYEIPIVFGLRIAGVDAVIHHHNYTYVSKYSRLMRFFVLVAGPRSIHVMLSEAMGVRFTSHYGDRIRTVTISNAVFLGCASRPCVGISKNGARIVGFMANLCADKGLWEVLALADQVRSANIVFKIAGPFLDDTERQRFLQAASAQPNVEYVGPVSGLDKEEFFCSLSCFVFPTKYANEAEPIVVLEAMRAGVPVIATGRGALPEMLEGGVGAICSEGERFSFEASAILLKWFNDGAPKPDDIVAAFLKYMQRSRSGLDVVTKHLLGYEMSDSELDPKAT